MVQNYIYIGSGMTSHGYLQALQPFSVERLIVKLSE